VLLGLAGCGVRAPARVDVDALLTARGPIEARRDLEIRVTSDPRDVAGRLALAALDERIHRPSEALEALEAVEALGGPLGVRWSDDDRARLGRLIALRGRTRLARGAQSALADLERARRLGAAIEDAELQRARAAGALVALRHSDAEQRDAGRRTLAAMTLPGSATSRVAGSGADARTAAGSDPGSAAASSADAVAGAGRAAARDTAPAVSEGRDAWLGARVGAGSAGDRADAAPAVTDGSDAWLGARVGGAPEQRGAAPAVSEGSDAWLGARVGGAPEQRGAAPAVSEGSDAWLGARVGASPEQRGRFGAWLWQHGARRAAWDELSAWHAATRSPRDPVLQGTYLTVARWWTPLDRPAPPAEDLVGPERCAFVPCTLHDAGTTDPTAEIALERAYLLAPLPPPTRDPDEAAALAAVALHQALRGEVSWGAALAARVDLPAFADPDLLAKLPLHVQPIFAQLLGRTAPIPRDGATPDQRLVIAAERSLAGAGIAEIEPLLVDAPYAAELRRVVAPRAPYTGDALAEAAARHAALAVPGTAARDALRTIAAAHARDPAIADRLARDAIAQAADAAALQATLAALFDALGDPARARTAWQAAVSASPEPAFVRGLAEACARQGDADAALIFATGAAAASGDPAAVWTSVAYALAGAGKYVHALDAARSAIDLAGPDALAAALDVAISASRALGRDTQAAALAGQRAHVAPAQAAILGDADPTDGRAALEAYRAHAGGSTIARLWVAARWNPRDVELRAALLAASPPDDARRAVSTGELVDLAGDRDPELRRAAVSALRQGLRSLEIDRGPRR
jgi:hypothetical protein